MEIISEEKYSDQTVILKKLKFSDQVVDIINKTFPGWILGWPKDIVLIIPFSNNWEFVCKKAGS